MDVKELIKFQMINQMGAQSQETTPIMLFYRVLLMGLMSVLDDILKSIPRLFETGKKYCFSYCKTQIKHTIDTPKTLQDLSIQLNTKHFENKFSMTRIYHSDSKTAQTSEESNGMFDAILAQISKLTNVPSFQLITRGQVMISYKEKPVQMTKDIFFKVDSISMGELGEVNSIKITLMSNAITAAEIVSYVSDIYENYLKDLKNSIGNRIFYFDQKTKETGPVQPPPTATVEAATNHRRMLLSTAPKQLSFTMSPFYSNKRMSNIFGEEARLVEKRMRFFMENREWYDEKGIPYQIGFLLSGLAGAGKTSLIKGIANYTKRHIINVNFANITTATQLKNLFYSDRVQVYTDTSMGNTQSYFIPIDQRIYVLEEIDAIGDIVKQRDPDTPSRSTIPDELTLAEILTVMDGTMEIPGRIIIMTTNHPEMLDRALVRPGRIDVHVNFGHAKRELIVEMFEAYFDMAFPENSLHRLPDRLLSPAQVGQVLFKHFDTEFDIEALMSDLEKAAGIQAAGIQAAGMQVNECSDKLQPSSVTVSEPTSEASEPTSVIVSEPTSEAVSEPTSVTVSEPSSETVSEPSSEVVSEPTSEVVSEPSSVTVSEPTSEIVSEPTSEVVSEPSSETVKEVEAKAENIRENRWNKVQDALSNEASNFNANNNKAEVMLSHGAITLIDNCPMFAPIMEQQAPFAVDNGNLFAVNELCNYALLE
jgi:hypothetical protein